MARVCLCRNFIWCALICVVMLIIFWQISVIPNQRIPSLPLQSNPAYDKLDNNEKALEANYEEASKAADESFQWFYYTEEMLNTTNGLPQENEELIAYVQTNLLIPPADNDEPYNLKEPKVREQSWQGLTSNIKKILNNLAGGFFVECGALDGETRSNSLYMERFMGWQGLLIEASPSNFKQVVEKNRKAWLAPTCLSVEQYPLMATFEENFNLGKIVALANHSAVDAKNKDNKRLVDIQCIPLTTLLLALNRTMVDYFSLDVEGKEFEVLKTINYDLIDIKTMTVEFAHCQENKEAMKTFMESKGYYLHTQLQNDFIFVKKDFKPKVEKNKAF